MRRLIFRASRRLLARLGTLLVRSPVTKRYGDIIHQLLFSGWRTVTYKDQFLSFNVPNMICDMRVKRIFSKEPGTINWIDSLEPGADILWDVGANLGLYSSLAASRGVETVAFEPSIFNLEVLALNLQKNGLEDSVCVVPIAVGGKASIYVHSSPMEGTELHGHSYPHLAALSSQNSYQGLFTLPALMLPLDLSATLFGLPMPTHMKFDIDGGEFEALSGARRVLLGLRSLLLETSAEDESRVGSLLGEFGFSRVNDSKYAPNVLWIRDQPDNVSTAP